MHFSPYWHRNIGMYLSFYHMLHRFFLVFIRYYSLWRDSSPKMKLLQNHIHFNFLSPHFYVILGSNEIINISPTNFITYMGRPQYILDQTKHIYYSILIIWFPSHVQTYSFQFPPLNSPVPQKIFTYFYIEWKVNLSSQNIRFSTLGIQPYPKIHVNPIFVPVFTTCLPHVNSQEKPDFLGPT